MIFRLAEDTLLFPPVELAEPDGLLAVGGDLSVERLLAAYRQGIFPWYSEGEPILWWCPRERYVIYPAEIHISKSMRKFIRHTTYRVSFDTAFAQVIHQCRKLREEREGTWITDEMERAYCRLYESGYAGSVEVWDNEELIGGLYGVRIGRCFFGESMFSLRKNASKLALILLAQELERRAFVFIDCQFHTEHLERMGGRTISYAEYMEQMAV